MAAYYSVVVAGTVAAVNEEVRARWLDAARRVDDGERENLLCPEHQDGYLEVRWVPAQDGVGGEYWLRCPACGAGNELLVRHRRPGSR
jgi:hypothetical protein